MPATEKQMRVAGRELRLRREGKVNKERDRKSATRPMGAMREVNLRKYAQSLDKEIAKLERKLKADPTHERALRLIKARRQKR